jgi:tetratricopeptide (TPR) repeat protein
MSSTTPATPSFVLGYWRPWAESANALGSYLDYTKDVSLTKYGADTVGKYVAQASKEHVQAIDQVARDIGQGFDVLAGRLSAIDESLGFLNRNMDMLIEQQQLSNLLLQNIAELLRVPDSEKERQRCIEQGVRFFVNAKQDPDLYVDALEMLGKAESLMKQDYFVLHRIGYIYLYAEKLVDPEKALAYFLRAAKYASIESDPSAIRLANALAVSFDVANSGIHESTQAVGLLAADSYAKAAFSAYVLGDFAQAVDLQAKAVGLSQTAQNRFFLSKYQARLGDVEQAKKNLDKAIDDFPLLVAAVFRELDLIGEPAILRLVEGKREAIEVCVLVDKRSQILGRLISRSISALERLKRTSGALLPRHSRAAGVSQITIDHNDRRLITSLVQELQEAAAQPVDARARESLGILERANLKYGRVEALLEDSLNKIRDYEKYVGVARRGGGLKASERNPIQWAISWREEEALAQLCVDALVIVAAVDGRVSSAEVKSISNCVGKLWGQPGVRERGLSGFEFGSEDLAEGVKRAVNSIRDIGATSFANSVRERLLPHRGTGFLKFVLRSQEQVVQADGLAHGKESQIIEWFRLQLGH